MTREESIKAALEIKRKAASKAETLKEAKENELKQSNAEYARICGEISSLGASLALTALSGDKAKIEKLKEKLTALSKEKSEILDKSGINLNTYSCALCSDTGYVNGKVCDCIKQSAKEIMLETVSKTAPVKDSRFENFDLSYYTDQAAKKRMTAIFKLAKEYALNFNENTKENLLFMGKTGLGKTHLSLGIVGEVIAKGYDVIYGSAYNLFSDMETEHFSLHTNTKYDLAVKCDLLVIDDLGGEFVSPYVQSLVYNILNTRLLSGKPTVINTNLSMEEISNSYTPRVASRLIGEYTSKLFLGDDVRQLKVFADK